MPRIYDISLPISPSLLVWPGDPEVEVRPASRIALGDAANVSHLSFSSHTGTHIDPPLHFIDGADPIDRIPLEPLVGVATVADLRGCPGNIGVEELEGLSLEADVTRLLLKTRNSERWNRMPTEFPDDYVSLSAKGAQWVVERRIRLVGIDFLGIEARGAIGHPTHTTLLEAGVVIVEGLNLSAVEPGNYQLACLPLRIDGGDGAPARAILIED